MDDLLSVGNLTLKQQVGE